MEQLLSEHEPAIRLAFLVGIFVCMAVWEARSPRRGQQWPRGLRWPNNLGLLAVDTLLVRLVFPLATVGMAIEIGQRGWGLFNAVQTPYWLAVLTSLLVLDLAIYFQHRLFHAVPWLWRLHRTHHADLDFDVTTALRFHPIEILLSMLVKLGVILALGAPALAALAFEIILNGMAMFNHANGRMPRRVDAVLRRLLVTPDMHRVHHSIVRAETDSNFGFNLSVWDRLFGTYRAQPAAGHEGMTIGIPLFRHRRDLWLDHVLLIPFTNPTGRDGVDGRTA